MPRFVLLRHECPPALAKASHWDLMLEDAGELLTWSMETLPSVGGPGVDAARLPNHRLAYLEYEGPVSGDRGDVARSDAGQYQWVGPTRSRIRLDGAMLRGELDLQDLGDGRVSLTLRP